MKIEFPSNNEIHAIMIGVLISVLHNMTGDKKIPMMILAAVLESEVRREHHLADAKREIAYLGFGVVSTEIVINKRKAKDGGR